MKTVHINNPCSMEKRRAKNEKVISDFLYAVALSFAEKSGLHPAPRPTIKLYEKSFRFNFVTFIQPIAAAVLNSLRSLGVTWDRCFIIADNRGMSTGMYKIKGRLSKKFVESVLAVILACNDNTNQERDEHASTN